MLKKESILYAKAKNVYVVCYMDEHLQPLDFSIFWKKFKKPEGQGEVTEFDAAAFDDVFGTGAADQFGLWMDKKAKLNVTRDPDKAEGFISEMQGFETELKKLNPSLDPTQILNARSNAALIDVKW